MQRGFRVVAGLFALVLLFGAAMFFRSVVAHAPVRFFEDDGTGVLVCQSSGEGPAGICLHWWDIPLASGLLLTGALGFVGAAWAKRRLLHAAAGAAAITGALMAFVVDPVSWARLTTVAPLVFFATLIASFLLAARAPAAPEPA